MSHTQGETLKKSRLGVWGVVFFVVAAASPLVGMTGAVPVAVVLGDGAAVPGAYLAVGLALLLFSVGYAAMSHRVTNTGAFFAYVGRGLGTRAGVGAAFVSLMAYIAVQVAIFGFFGAVAAGQMKDSLGLDMPWWAWTLIAWAIVTLLSLRAVDVGAKILGVFIIFEVLSLFVLAIAILVQGGPENFDLGASFNPANIFAGGLNGTAGIALSFAFASFIGFEASAIYGEESKDPKRVVPRATYISILLITGLFVITTLAMVTGMGASKVVDKVVEYSSVGDVPLANPANVLFTMADQYVGSWLATIMSWLVISSLFAGLLAFHNSIARYFFSMGRAGVLPSALAKVNKQGAPSNATYATAVVGALIVILFAARGLDPVLNLFYWFSGLSVVAMVFVEILVSLAVIRYFQKTKEDTRPWNTLIAPILAIISLGLGEYLLMSRFGLLAGTVAEGVDPTAQSWGLSPLGWFLILLPFIVFVVGVVVSTIRRNENEEMLKDLVN